METLENQEIEGIWERIKRYITLNDINAADKTNQIYQLEEAMMIKTAGDGRTAQGNMDYLIKQGFPKAAINDEKIRGELIGGRIQEIKIKGQTRFQVKKGTQSLRTDGHFKVRAGWFLKGKTREEAAQSLLSRLG